MMAGTLWNADGGKRPRRAKAIAALPQRTVPDFCEMALVANATGLMPDRPDFHAPLTRAVELPWRFCDVTSPHVSRPWPPAMGGVSRMAR